MKNNLESLTELFKQIEKGNDSEFWAGKNTKIFKLWLCSFLLEEIRELIPEEDLEIMTKVMCSGDPDLLKLDKYSIALANLIENSDKFKNIVDSQAGSKLGVDVKNHIYRLVDCVKYIERISTFPHWNNVTLKLVEDLSRLLKDKSNLDRFNKDLPFMVNMLVD